MSWFIQYSTIIHWVNDIVKFTTIVTFIPSGTSTQVILCTFYFYCRINAPFSYYTTFLMEKCSLKSIIIMFILLQIQIQTLFAILRKSRCRCVKVFMGNVYYNFSNSCNKNLFISYAIFLFQPVKFRFNVNINKVSNIIFFFYLIFYLNYNV